MALQSCTECGHMVSDRATSCPSCGAPVDNEQTGPKVEKRPAKKKRVTTGRILVGIIVVVSLFAIFGPDPTPEQIAAREAAAAERAEEKAEAERLAIVEKEEENRKGFHCLSSWDGSHRDVVNAVKATLRNPDSFEHVETRVTPVDNDRRHLFFMQYRAENGFGGVNLETASGTYGNVNCNDIQFQ